MINEILSGGSIIDVKKANCLVIDYVEFSCRFICLLYYGREPKMWQMLRGRTKCRIKR